MGRALELRSYAKINLYLDVLNRRDDGFHNIETIFQSVSLFDRLIVTQQSSGITLECSDGDLDTGETNLVYRAAALLQERTGSRDGVHVYLDKRIPIAAGLAGGSGNAAATLLALNDLWDLRLSDADLAAIALELGSDVPYCLVGGTMAATARGEVLEPLQPVAGVAFILLHPDLSVSTSRIYNSDLLRRNMEPRTHNGRTGTFVRALAALSQNDWSHVVFNRMEEPVFHDYPHVAELVGRLREGGCLAAAMSGSGPTVFGVCADKAQANEVAARFSDVRATVVTPVSAGVEQLN